MVNAVCDKEDCPFYGCFNDVGKYKPIKKLQDEFGVEKNFNNTINMALQLQALVLNIKTTCISCMHFNKQDKYSELVSGRAKMNLLGDINVFSSK